MVPRDTSFHSLSDRQNARHGWAWECSMLLSADEQWATFRAQFGERGFSYPRIEVDDKQNGYQRAL